MKAAILAVGSELLGTQRLDTNSLALTDSLLRHGVTLERKGVVGDSREGIASELGRMAEDVDLVVITGGLGIDIANIGSILKKASSRIER